MDAINRSKYADYLAEAIRFIQKESGLTLPTDTILITKSYCELSDLDEIIGIKIFVCDISSPYDFFIAFSSSNTSHYKLQKYFDEYINMYDLEF